MRTPPRVFADAARSFRRRAGWTALVLLLCGVALAQVRRARDPDRPRGLLGALAGQAGGVRDISPRLSVAEGYRPCTPRPAAAPGLPDMGCAPGPPWRPSRASRRVLRRVQRAVDGDASLDAMHASAVAELMMDAGRGNPTDRSIQTLWTVARASAHPAGAWGDLSAAYLLRAEQGGARRDLLAAVEAAERALEHAPRDRSALFNRALALQRFGLMDAADPAWRAYLAVDARSPWAAEARRRLQTTSAGPGGPATPPAKNAPLSAYADYARADPQAARLLGQDRLLGEWGSALLAGDTARAGLALRRAEALGGALRRRPGGDGTLAEEVDAIRARGGGAGLRALAAAHRDYAAGTALYDAARYVTAEPRMRAAAAAGSPALAAWARLFLANLRVYAGEVERGEAMMVALTAETDTLRRPALAARINWAVAGTRMRTDRYEAALAPAEASFRWFTRAGEHELAGTILSGLANAKFVLGETDAGYADWHRALGILRPYRRSDRLHGLLVAIATAAADDGLARAAVRLQDEGVAVTLRRAEPVRTAEARLARARLLPSLGRMRGAAEDLDAARTALRDSPRETLKWMGADLREAEGLALLFARPARPAEAAAALDAAATYFAVGRVPFRAFPALVSAAEARLAMGDLPGATRRLESAFAMLEARRDSVRLEARRAAVFDQARGVVDGVVLLHLAAGRPADALRFLDHARASLAPSAAEPAGSRERALEGPPGEVGVEYALVADTLLAWTVAGEQVAVARTVVDTVRLARSVARLRGLLQAGGDEAAIQALLEQLHGWLIRPVLPRLGPAGTRLVLVADGLLAQVPFAALRGAGGGRYLVEEHPLRFAVSLREAWRARPAARAGGTVLVADPAFEPRDHPGLQRLPGAAAEAREIAGVYGAPALLAGEAATPAAVRQALARAGVLHYAGHAVFDDERPEGSYLVLAPGRPGAGRLTAGELAGMRLDRAPLVVLAACRSINGGSGRASGFSGLAGALLAAGAGGVVGGLWEVDDQRTQPLMIAFHRAYHEARDGAGALRTAQLRMMESGNPALRSPAAWSGFRYAGR